MKGKKKDAKSKSKSKRFASAVVIILLTAAAFFSVSDASFIKNARDALMHKLGYEATDQSGQGGEDDSGGSESSSAQGNGSGSTDNSGDGASLADLEAGSLPDYNGDHYVVVNGNVPEFPDDVCERAGMVDADKLNAYEYYGSFDSLGRCTYAYGCLGSETMPQEGEERGDISSVHPSGWAKAQGWERCHLIAWALSNENANPQNLITGTHYLNYDGMRPLEEEVEHYIWNTGNHVLYMARPWFSGDELVARGVQLTAKSVEDDGKGISFNVYCFNVTPDAEINYLTGVVTTAGQAAQEARTYIINTRTGVFHYPTCDGVKEMSERNKKEVTATRKELTDQGYTPCGYCEP